VAFSPNRLPSIPSVLAPVALELKNTLPQSITARVSVRGPRNWYIEPRTAEFRLGPGEGWKERLEVALPDDVVGGRQMVRLDFEIQAGAPSTQGRHYRFTMYRPLEITLGDVLIEGRAVLNGAPSTPGAPGRPGRGEMEVYQTLTNQGKKPAGFRCDLLAPDRRRQSTEVHVQPSGTSQVTYHLPDGEQLLGKTIWLRAEEIDGPRVLNYRIENPGTMYPRSSSPTAPMEGPKHRQPSRPDSSLVL
jgi:hypothetical protein